MATTSRTLSDIVLPRPNGMSLGLLRDTLLVLGGSALVAGLARLVIPMQPVPITGQTLGVLLVGAALGWRRGGLALLAYLIEGLVGLPVFAGGLAGLSVLFGPTGGYLVGFIFAAMLVGFLAERGWDRTPWMMALALVLGNQVIYACGLGWLGYILTLSVHSTLTLGLFPFLIGDAIKLAVAVVLLPGAWLLVGRNKAR